MTTQDIRASPGYPVPGQEAESFEPSVTRDSLELVEAVGRIVRIVARMKAELGARHPGSGTEYGAMSLLVALVENGPRRAGTLAESVLMDPSQVSRRVAALVRAGFVERRADFADGRAILLAATPAGTRVCRAMLLERARYLRGVVADWPAADLDAFTRYLDRFAANLENTVTRPGPRTGAPDSIKHDLPREHR